MIRSFLFALVAPFALAGCTTLDTATPPSAALTEGVVSAADPRAAEAGAEMLRRGGSATDASIAVMLALTVVEPQSSGIGGGGFYLHGTPEGTVTALDGRETAPGQAGPDWFLAEDGEPHNFMDAVLSGLSIGVPGNVALAAEAHERHGRLAWAELFEPAIALASDGFVITERFREFLSFGADRAAHDPLGQALFYDEQGEPLPVGTRVRNPELAATFERIAAQGPETFYTGDHARALAITIEAATPGEPGMSHEDIAEYEAIWRDPVCGEYRAYRICGMGPPSSGATTVFAILKQLENFDLASLGPDSPVAWHLFAESQRLAYADRELFLADEDFVPVPVAGLMDADYLLARGALISAERRMAEISPGEPAGARRALADGDEPMESGTSHFVAVDPWGNAVSWTSTIEGSFGSGHMFGGFYLNNELTDFSFRPEMDGLPVANRVEGGKRPRSSMAPTIVYDPQGRLVLAIGAAGGGTIPVQVAKALIGVIDWDLTADEAIALPGLYAPGDTITLEADSPLLRFREYWEALGHTIAARRLPFKGNAAQLVAGEWMGVADPRSEGAAIRP